MNAQAKKSSKSESGIRSNSGSQSEVVMTTALEAFKAFENTVLGKVKKIREDGKGTSQQYNLVARIVDYQRDTFKGTPSKGTIGFVEVHMPEVINDAPIFKVYVVDAGKARVNLKWDKQNEKVTPEFKGITLKLVQDLWNTQVNEAVFSYSEGNIEVLDVESRDKNEEEGPKVTRIQECKIDFAGSAKKILGEDLKTHHHPEAF